MCSYIKVFLILKYKYQLILFGLMNCQELSFSFIWKGNMI